MLHFSDMMIACHEKAHLRQNWVHLQSLTEYLRHFFVLSLFPFTKSELELDDYHQKLNVQVASRVAERRQAYDLSKWENFRKISKLSVDIA